MTARCSVAPGSGGYLVDLPSRYETRLPPLGRRQARGWVSKQYPAADMNSDAFEGWFDMRDLGAVLDHEEPLPNPACDQVQ